MQRRATLRVAHQAHHSEVWDLFFMAALAAFTLALGLLGFVLADAIVDHTPGRSRASGASQQNKTGAGDEVRAVHSPAFPAAEDARLQAAILDVLGAEAGRFGVVARRLDDGLTARVNGDHVFYAASTFKLAILYEAERRRSQGLLDFNAPLLLDESDLSEDLGTFGEWPRETNGALTVGAALEAMITFSDNVSAVALMRLLGPDAIDATLASLGLERTSVNTRDLPTTASDMALLMEAIVRGTGVDREARDHMRSLLLGQRIRDGIPAGLPGTALVGNKTGTWDGITHDVAFVESGGATYVIAVLSASDRDWGSIARVSQAVNAVLAP